MSGSSTKNVTTPRSSRSTPNPTQSPKELMDNQTPVNLFGDLPRPPTKSDVGLLSRIIYEIIPNDSISTDNKLTKPSSSVYILPKEITVASVRSHLALVLGNLVKDISMYLPRTTFAPSTTSSTTSSSSNIVSSTVDEEELLNDGTKSIFVASESPPIFRIFTKINNTSGPGKELFVTYNPSSEKEFTIDDTRLPSSQTKIDAITLGVHSVMDLNLDQHHPGYNYSMLPLIHREDGEEQGAVCLRVAIRNQTTKYSQFTTVVDPRPRV